MENILNSTQNILNISADLGKNEFKGFSFDTNGHIKKYVNFDSRKRNVISSHVYSSNSNPNKFKVEYENQRFEIGDNIENGSYSNENSKVNNHHKLCLLVGVGLLVETDNQVVNVCAGLPSSHISNMSERKAFEEMLKDHEGKSISITINGEYKTFMINSIKSEPEGLATLPRLELMLNNVSEDIAVIDIGGHNFNLRLFDEFGYSLDDRGVSEESVGINTLINNFKTELISNLKNRDRKISNNDIKRFILNRDLDDDIELLSFEGSNSDFVSSFVKNYIEEYITNRLSSYSIKINAKGMKYLFTGGGSALLKPYIEEMYPNNIDSFYFSQTSKWDNCISFALNRLFKINPNKAQIFSTIKEDAINKLPNQDKSIRNNKNNIHQLQNLIYGFTM